MDDLTREEIEAILMQVAAPLNQIDVKNKTVQDTTIRYIDARAVITRLNTVCPADWSRRFKVRRRPGLKRTLTETNKEGDSSVTEWHDPDSYVVECTLTICGISRSDTSEEMDGEHWGGAPKSAYSDAFKRAAVAFGFAMELYAPEKAVNWGDKLKVAIAGEMLIAGYQLSGGQVHDVIVNALSHAPETAEGESQLFTSAWAESYLMYLDGLHFISRRLWADELVDALGMELVNRE